jgi:hypothetical protein
MDLFNTCDDRWTKVLVTLDNKKFNLVSKGIKGVALVPQEITSTLLGVDSMLDIVAKGLQAAWDASREHKVRRDPVRLYIQVWVV